MHVMGRDCIPLYLYLQIQSTGQGCLGTATALVLSPTPCDDTEVRTGLEV